ncbi:hypothetical protein F4678DRAFT_28556 [Xylaria arbuscula]|nr:hypothetical protein F4678DRAFT_28556 [Xylaria arbuscula]
MAENRAPNTSHLDSPVEMTELTKYNGRDYLNHRGRNDVHILDIMPDGKFLVWGQCTFGPDYLTMLENDCVSNGTRLIILHCSSWMKVGNHIVNTYGTSQDLERVVRMNFHELGPYGSIQSPLPEFLVGGKPKYLDLGYGWAVEIILKKDYKIVLVSTPNSGDPRVDIRHDLVKFREEYLQALLTRNENFFVESHENPLLLLLPVLHIHAKYLYKDLIRQNENLHRGIALREESEVIEEAWYSLRITRHYGMRPLDCIRQYDNDYNSGKVQHSEEYKALAKRFRCIEEQICRTEALARDCLQHHVAMLGLKESRASIKQANIALEESRRTKLITVLAIFFVPISLSTSVFGMNINELNQNGQSLWVFIVTTVVIVAATLTVWGLMFQVQKYNSLPRRDDHGEGVPWYQRLILAFLLVGYGHVVWAWQSGIIVSLLTDGQVAFLRSCTSDSMHRGAFLNSSHDRHQPSRYIDDHLMNRCGFQCFELENTA